MGISRSSGLSLWLPFPRSVAVRSALPWQGTVGGTAAKEGMCTYEGGEHQRARTVGTRLHQLRSSIAVKTPAHLCG